MNQAGEIISDILQGTHFKTVIIANRAYTFYPLTIKQIVGLTSKWSGLNAENINLENPFSVISAISKNQMAIIDGLTSVLTDNPKIAQQMKEDLSQATNEELLLAMETCLEMIFAKEAFQSAVLAESVTLMTAQPI